MSGFEQISEMCSPFVRLFALGRTFSAVKLGRRPGRRVLCSCPLRFSAFFPRLSQARVSADALRPRGFTAHSLTRHLRSGLVADRSDTRSNPSLTVGALNVVRGPSCSHCADHSLLPQRELQGGALQTFLQGRKKRQRFALRLSRRPNRRWRLEPSRLLT